jgi:hypothetical protein
VIEPVPVLKDEHHQQLIPTLWRSTFAAIVESLKEDDFVLEKVAGVRPISADQAATMKMAVHDYGARLASLPEDAWNTSVCQWMLTYWDVLIDLFTIEEGASDLVLTVRVREDGPGYAFEVQSVYVP